MTDLYKRAQESVIRLFPGAKRLSVPNLDLKAWGLFCPYWKTEKGGCSVCHVSEQQLQ